LRHACPQSFEFLLPAGHSPSLCLYALKISTVAWRWPLACEWQAEDLPHCGGCILYGLYIQLRKAAAPKKQRKTGASVQFPLYMGSSHPL
jgi:hypothetical protein